MGTVQAARLSQGIRRLLSLRETFAPPIAEEWLAVINGTNPNDSIYYRGRSETLISLNVLQTNVAANVTRTTIAPRNRFEALVLETLTLAAGANVTTGMEIDYGWVGEARNVGAQSGFEMDSRGLALTPTSASPLISSTNFATAAAAFPQGFAGRLFAPANTTIVIPLRAVIFGGLSSADTDNIVKLGFVQQTVNTGYFLTVQGYIRTLEVSEVF